jgi:hypothetical protein
MALTISTPSNAMDVAGVPGNNKYVIKRILFDSSYATGGESLTPTQLGFDSLHIMLTSSEDNGYVAEYDYSGEKLVLYEAGADGAALDEVADTTDVSSVYVRILTFGV